MSSIQERKKAAFLTFMRKQGLSADGWEVHVSPNTGKILRYTHPNHGRFGNRESVVRALRPDAPRANRDPAAAGPSNAIYVSSGEEDDEDADKCMVCFDEPDPEDTFTVEGCGHRFCSSCMGQHFEANASDSATLHPKRHLPWCPTCKAKKAHNKMCYGGVITPENIDALHRDGHVTDGTHKRLHKAIVMASVPKGDHRVTCPKCDALFLVDPGAGTDGYKVDCPNRDCDCVGLCARCMVVHPGECPQVVDDMTKELFVGAVACPGTCGFMLQKRDDECNCLQCDKCGISVCGLCGADITAVSHRHFDEAGACYDHMYTDPVAWAKANASKE